MEKKAIGLGSGIGITVICGPDGKIVKELYHFGNFEPFRDLLVTNKIPIRSMDDATLIWDAFCDLHQLHWKGHPAERVAPDTWRFGDNTIENTHYYYEATLDENSVVQSFTSHAVKVAPPVTKEPYETGQPTGSVCLLPFSDWPTGLSDVKVQATLPHPRENL
jgi:hypothetical protein